MNARRFQSSSSRFKFYDLIKKSNRHPVHNLSPAHVGANQSENGSQGGSSKGQNANDPSRGGAASRQAKSFQGNYTIDKASAEERIRKVFGGRIAGEDRQSSSRRLIGQPRIIAGIKVPDKPKEPDNCCMSGCINCVWETYNDDVKEWNAQRSRAAKRLVERGGVWPADFYPPVQLLNKENLPESVSKEAAATSHLGKAGAPGSSGEGWDSVPVQIRAFAEMEKKLKTRRKSSKMA